MDPGRDREPEDPSEGPSPWTGGRSRDLGDRVSVMETEFRHLNNNLKQFSTELVSLRQERRDAGAELERQIKELTKELHIEMEKLGDRIGEFEDTRRVNRKLFRMGMAVAAAVAWFTSTFGSYVSAAIRRIFSL